ncbi:MAG: hypothetical protein Q9162_004114 [Coniocarpon cinnabarinum]
MGLAGGRKRQKISHDPNNTLWARNTSTYGQRILASKGWTPGSTLGAKDAAHSSHYTSASESHVRIQPREENLGLGASLQQENDAKNVQRMGAFNDILSRLNGEPDPLQEEKKRMARENLSRRLYLDKKLGPMRFVRAGFLVGSEIRENVSAEVDGPDSLSRSLDVATGAEAPFTEEDAADRKRRKEEKRARKERRRAKREMKAASNPDLGTSTVGEVAIRRDSQRKRPKFTSPGRERKPLKPQENFEESETREEARRRRKLRKQARKDAQQQSNAKEDSRHVSDENRINLSTPSVPVAPIANPSPDTALDESTAPPQGSNSRGMHAVRKRGMVISPMHAHETHMSGVIRSTGKKQTASLSDVKQQQMLVHLSIKLNIRRTTSRGRESVSSGRSAHEDAPEPPREPPPPPHHHEVPEVISSAENSAGPETSASGTSDEEAEDEEVSTGEEQFEEEEEDTDPSSHPPPAPEAPPRKENPPPPRKERRAAHHREQSPPRREHHHSRGAHRRPEPVPEETSSLDYEYSSENYSYGQPPGPPGHGWTWVPDSDHGQPYPQPYPAPPPPMQQPPQHGYQQPQYYENRPPQPPPNQGPTYVYQQAPQPQPQAQPAPQPAPAPAPQPTTQLVHVPSHEPFYNPFASPYHHYMQNPFSPSYGPHAGGYFPPYPYPYPPYQPPTPQREPQASPPPPPPPPPPDPRIDDITKILKDQMRASEMAQADAARAQHDAARDEARKADDIFREQQARVDRLTEELEKFEAEKRKAEQERETKKIVDAAVEKSKLEQDAAAKTAADKKAEEHRKALEKAKEAEKKAEEAKKKAEEDLAGIKPSSDDVQKPIKFEDAGMYNLIQQAFRQIENYDEEVANQHFDLIGPDGEIILPATWEVLVQPDWTVKMHMWPMAKEVLEEKPKPEMPDVPPEHGHHRPGRPKKDNGGRLFGFGKANRNRPKKPAAELPEVLDDGMVASAGGPEIAVIGPEPGGKPQSNRGAKRRSMNTGLAMYLSGGGVRRPGR